MAAGDPVGFFRVRHGHEVDVHCAQFFVNSSPALVLLLRRRLESVADVLEGIFGVGFFLSLVGMLFLDIGRLSVVTVRVVQSLPFIPGIGGFHRFAWFL